MKDRKNVSGIIKWNSPWYCSLDKNMIGGKCNRQYGEDSTELVRPNSGYLTVELNRLIKNQAYEDRNKARYPWHKMFWIMKIKKALRKINLSDDFIVVRRVRVKNNV